MAQDTIKRGRGEEEKSIRLNLLYKVQASGTSTVGGEITNIFEVFLLFAHDGLWSCNRGDSGIIVELSNHSSTDSCSTQTINVKRISMVQITTA